MADLPSSRVTPDREHSYIVKLTLLARSSPNCTSVCNRTTKSYVSVFVCMVTKQIRLELVSDLSSDAFLASNRRFIATKGPLCTDIYSDCGTNFIDAAKEMKIIESQIRHEKFRFTMEHLCISSHQPHRILEEFWRLGWNVWNITSVALLELLHLKSCGNSTLSKWILLKLPTFMPALGQHRWFDIFDTGTFSNWRAYAKYAET